MRCDFSAFGDCLAGPHPFLSSQTSLCPRTFGAPRPAWPLLPHLPEMPLFASLLGASLIPQGSPELPTPPGGYGYITTSQGHQELFQTLRTHRVILSPNNARTTIATQFTDKQTEVPRGRETFCSSKSWSSGTARIQTDGGGRQDLSANPQDPLPGQLSPGA